MMKYTKYLMAILMVGVATTAMRAQSTLIGTIDGRHDGNIVGRRVDVTATDENLGYSLAMSKDGNRIAIGSPVLEIVPPAFGFVNDTRRGNVKIYDWNGTAWDQVGGTIEGEGIGDQFGISVDLSGSGDTLAVGAHYNDGTATDAGHVRIYAWDGTTWTQLGNDIDGGLAEDYFGTSVALTPDGNRVVVGAVQGLGNPRGGYVRTLTWNGTDWIPQDTVRGRGNLRDGSSNSSSHFGRSVALSDDGNRLIVGANGFGHDLRFFTSGLQTDVTVYDWEENRGQWTENHVQPRGSVPLSSSSYVGYGTSVDVSADGNRWAVSNPVFGSRGRPEFPSFIDVFDRNEEDTGWEQSGDSITGTNIYQEFFGWDLQLSADGNLLVAGRPRRVTTNNNRSESEDTYVYEWSSFKNTWIRTEILRGEGVGNREGISLALSDDGSRLAIGADRHGRNGTRIGRVRVFDNLNRLPFLTLTSIAPATTANSRVDTLIITDPNLPNDDHTLAISGTDADQFRFNNDTTLLLTSNAFGMIRDINSTYSFTITITDRAGAVHPQPIVLTVEDAPIAPSDIELSKDSIFEREPIGTFIGTLSATDPNGNISGYTIEGTSPFEISGDTLRSSEVFEFSTQNSYPLTITVTDSTGLTSSKTFTIRIRSAAPTALQLSKDSIFERLPIDTLIGTLSATDPNNHNPSTYTYSILPVVGRSDTSHFQIVGNELRSDTIFDFQTQNSYPLSITVTDSTELTYSETFTIRILSAAPTDIALSYTPIFEGEPTGTFIGTFTTTDPNDNDHIYSILPVVGRSDTSHFQIVGNELQNRIPLVYESDSTYELTIQTKDHTGLTYSETFTIRILSAAPTDLALSYTPIFEREPIGTLIGTFATTDPNDNDHTYSILPVVGRSDTSHFQIVGNELQNRIPLDYESDSTYELTIRTTDHTGLTYSETFTIRILSAAPTDLALSYTPIFEREPIGTLIGTFATTDPNDHDPSTYTYSILPVVGRSDTSHFQIFGNELQSRIPLDYESDSTYELTIRTTDHTGLTYSETFTIRILSAAPTDLALSSNSLSENTPIGTRIGTLTTTDPNDNDHTYSIFPESRRDTFQIVDNELQNRIPLDYESDSTYEVTIRTTDHTGLTYSETFTINITNVEEDPFAPFAYDTTTHRNDSIDENYTGFIGRRSPLIFEQGTTMNDFTITDSLLVPVEFENFFTYRGDSLFLLDTLDHEISNHRNIDIQMRLRHDVNRDSILITVTTLRLRNVNEFSPTDLRWVGGDVQLGHNRPSEVLNENTPLGHAIRNEQGNRSPIFLEVRDKDDYGPTDYSHTRHTFSIVSGNESGFFKICKNNRNGVTRNEICVARPLDVTDANRVAVAIGLETVFRSEFRLGFRATDRGGLTVDHNDNFFIRVRDVEEAPRDLMLTADSIGENNPPNAVIGILSNADNDRNDRHTYTITNGNVMKEGSNLFEIVEDTLKVTQLLDYETDPTSYELTITATDLNGNTGSETFTIRVLNLSPEPPVELKLSPDSISENNLPNVLVGRISHKGDHATYAITRNVMKDGENLFAIAGDSLIVTQSLDYENDPTSYTVTITATTTDANQNTGSGMLTLRLIDVPEIVLSEQNIRTDNDIIPSHTLVGTITHPVPGDDLSLTLTGTDLLTLDGDTLRVAEDLDVSQGGKSFRITIRVVSDTDTLKTETFLITLAKNNYGNPHDSQTLLGESLNEQQGKAVALSANGRRMVIGTDLYDNSRGRVRVMEQNIATKAWTQMGDYLTGRNSSDLFGGAVDINPEGNRIAIAAHDAMVETNRPGVVYIYQWEGSQWTLLGDSLAGNGNFGSDIALTNEGNLLIVGEPDNDRGRVHIYEWQNNSSWTRLQTLNHNNNDNSIGNVLFEQFGFSVAASTNADRIVVGIPEAEEGSNVADPGLNSGIAFVYHRNGNTWRKNQQLTVGEPNFRFNDRDENRNTRYGRGVAMSPDGARLAVGTPFRHHPNNNARGDDDGLIIIYEYSSRWNNIDTILGRNGRRDELGKRNTFEFSPDGTRLAVGIPEYGNNGRLSLYQIENSRRITNLQNWNGNSTGDRLGTAVDISHEGIMAAGISGLNDTTNNRIDVGGVRIIYERSNPSTPPTLMFFSEDRSLSEDTPIGTLIDSLYITDPDPLDNTFALTLSGEGSEDFIAENQQFRVNQTLDFSENPIYTLNLTIDDGRGGVTTIDNFITIHVINVLRPPTGIELSSLTINENTPAGTPIATLTTIDPDTEDTHVYELTGADEASFIIENDNELKFNGIVPDFETQRTTYSLTIISRETNNRNFFVSQNFTITVIDLPEAPANITLTNNIIDENEDAGTTIGTFRAEDEDNNETLRFSFVDSSSITQFQIVDDSLLQTTADSLNFEADSTHTLAIIVTDKDGLTETMDFVISVQNINEAPTDIVLSSPIIIENTRPEDLVNSLFTTGDPDTGDTHTYTIGGIDSSFFNIANGNVLRFNTVPDFEDPNHNINYVLTITTDDGNGGTFSKDFTLTVVDLNEPPTNITLTNDTIDENEAAGTTIGTLSNNDPDAGDTHFYSLTPPNDTFRIDGDILKTSRILDFETKNSYTLSITADDGKGGGDFDTTFTITVQNVNEAPTEIMLSNNSIDENSPVGTFISTLTTTDPDIGDTHTYALGNEADANAFLISNDSLLVNQLFNFEADPSYTFTLTTTDLDGLSRMRQLTITIENVNEAPTGFAISHNPARINENLRGVAISTFSGVQDPEPGDAHTFSIEEDNVPFNIVGTELRTHSVDSIDYETQAQYTLTIIVTDQGNLTAQQELIVNIGNRDDENPTDITLSSNTISENLSANTLIGTLTSIDPDDGGTPTDSYTYSLSGSDATNFSIMNTNQLVSRTANFDFETKATYDITITSDDRDGGTFMKDFTISITDSNDPPTDIALSSNVVSRNAPIGTVIGNFSATDQDNSDSHSFTFTTADPNPFEIDNTNSLRTTAALQQDSYSISVTANDGNGGTFDATFTINALNFVIMLSNNSIPENDTIGTTIGFLSTSDNTNDATRIFTLVPSMTNFAIVGDTLKSNVVFDYEEGNNTQSISITTTNDVGEDYSQPFMINIMNVNETPTEITLSNNTIDENSPEGTTIGTLRAEDQDNNETHRFFFVDNNITRFSITDNSLLQTTSIPLDYEEDSTFTLNIYVADKDGLSDTMDIVIKVQNVNEAPTALSFVHDDNGDSTIVVNENSPVGTFISTLTTTDPDIGDTHTYALGNGADASAFRISNDSLLVNQLFNFETDANGNTYTFTLTTTDLGGLSIMRQLTISIKNVNEAPTGFTISDNPARIDENLRGIAIATFSNVQDPEPGDAHTFSIEEDNVPFNIVGTELRTHSVDSIDYETQAQYTLTIIVTDQGNLTAQQELTVNIGNLNDENPTDITLSSNTISENSPAGTLIGTFTSIDPDDGGTPTDLYIYSSSGSDATNFNITNNELFSRTANFDFETKATYDITITSNDRVRGSFMKDFTINVTDSNDPPTDIALSSNVVRRDAPIGTVIGNFSATDQDNSDSHTFSLTSDIFQIVGDTLKTKALLQQDIYSISVTADDGNRGTFDEVFTINALDFIIILPEKTIDENQPIGTTIGFLSTSDDTNDATRTFTLVPSMTNFAIVGDTLKSNVVFDYEEGNNTQSISITTTNNAGGNYSQTFMINIMNVNEAPTEIMLSNNAIIENSPIGTTIGTLTTTDPDAGDTHMYSLSTPNDTFLIVGDTLKTNSALDFETKSSYTISITTTDGGGSTFDMDFTITINDFNEHVNSDPTDIMLSSNAVAENSPTGSFIGTLSSTDLDTGDTHTYTLTTPNDTFLIVGDTLKTNSVFDFETQSSYSLSITTTDSSGSTFDKDFTINVTDSNDVPTDINLSNSVVERATSIGTVIGNFSATDPDNGDSHTFTLTSDIFQIVGDTLKTKALLVENTYSISVTADDGNGGIISRDFTIMALDFVILLSNSSIPENDTIGTTIGLLSTSDDTNDSGRTFALDVPSMTNFAIVGDTLKSNVIFDYEEGNNIQSISITTTDDEGEDYPQTFMINITNVSDQPPTDITLSNNTVDEDQPIGTTIGTLSTTDLDAGDTHTYTLTTPNDTFQIVGDTLKTNSVLDFETKSSYSLSITTNDGNEGSFDKVFTISVNDLDENANNDPTDITLSNDSIDEDSPIGTTIGTLTTTDLDTGDTHTYTLTTPNDTFLIEGNILKTNRTFDFETQSSYSLSITTTDSSGSTFNKDFTITINDVEENTNSDPTDITLSISTVDENEPVGTEIGRLFTVDPDAGDTHTYTLTTPNDTFQIVGDTLKTNSVLDFETQSSYTLSITTTDNSGGSFDKEFTITVNDVEEDGALSINEVDHLVQVLPVFVKDKCALNIEHAFIGKVVVNMYTLNGTTAKTLVYNKNLRNMSKNIPVTLLPSGVYIVKIQFGNLVALKKIVKH